MLCHPVKVLSLSSKLLFDCSSAHCEGKLELIKYFHGKRYPLNKKDMDGETPIFLAAIKGFWNIVYYLHEIIEHHKKKRTKRYVDALIRIL